MNYKTVCFGLIGVGIATMFLAVPIAGSLIIIAASIFAVADSILDKK